MSRSALLLFALAACGDNTSYPEGVLFSGSNCCWNPLVDDGVVVFSDQTDLLRVSVDGGSATRLGANATSTNYIIANGVVVWSTDDGLWKMDLEGTRTRLSVARGRRVASNGSFIYVGTETGDVLRVPATGGTAETIHVATDAISSIVALATSPPWVYFVVTSTSSNPTSALWRVADNGATAAEPLPLVGNPFVNDLVVDGEIAYIATSRGMQRSSASGATELGPDREIVSIALSDHVLYAETYRGVPLDTAIVRYDADGPHPLVTATTFIDGIATDGTRMFYGILDANDESGSLAWIPL